MKIFLKLVSLYISLLLFFSLSIICVYHIPQQYIRENIQQSVKTIDSEGLVPLMWNTPFYRLDTFTDCLMFNAALCSEDNRAIHSAFINNIYLQSNNDILSATKRILQNNEVKHSANSYARYWHGYAIFLRPLLTITDYDGIRIINTITLYTLCIIITILLYKKRQKQMAITFFLSTLLINLYVVAQTIQFSTCFYISFIGMLFIILFPAMVYKNNYILLFFGIGALTSFLDLLTTPLITLGLPLLTFIGIYISQKRIIKVIISSFSWGIGYSSIWISKWILSYLITGQNTFASAEQAAITRIGRLNIINNIKWSVGIDIHEIMRSSSFYIFLGVLFFILFLLLAYLKSKRKLNNTLFMKKYTYIIIIATFVPIWFYIMKNHSFVHFWFTWRNIIIPLWCILLFFSYLINFKSLNK